MVSAFRVGLVGSKPEAVLIAKFLADAGINLLDRLLLGNLIKAPAGLLGQSLHDGFTVGVALRSATPTASATASTAAGVSAAGVSAARIAAAMAPTTGVPSARITTARITSASTSTSTVTPAGIPCRVVIGLGIGEENGVHQGIGALGRFDGPVQAGFAALVDAVGEDDECFATLQFAHELVRGKKDRVVEQGATAHVRGSRPPLGLVPA